MPGIQGDLDTISRISRAVVLEPGIRFDLRRMIACESHDQRAIGAPTLVR